MFLMKLLSDCIFLRHRNKLLCPPRGQCYWTFYVNQTFSAIQSKRKQNVINHACICNHGNCKLCSSIAASNKIMNKQTNKKFEIKHGGTCQTKDVIFAAECHKHKKLYIRQSKCQLNNRFCGHRFEST